MPRLVGQKHSTYVACRHVKHTFHGSSLPCKGKSMFKSSRHSTFVHYPAACVHKMSQYWNVDAIPGKILRVISMVDTTGK